MSRISVENESINQGLAEGLDQTREAGKAIQSLKNLAVMKSTLTMQQLSQAGREAIVSNAINAAKTLEQSYLQNKQQGNAIFVRALRDEIDNFMRGSPINASFPETDIASELGDLLQGKLGKVNFQQGVAEGESNRAMWDRIRSKGIVPGIDREKYTERPGLEGPFHTKTGKVVYYDKQEGKYYDPDTDFYISHDDYRAMNEQGVAEGLPGEFIGGTAGGVGGAVVGAAVGGPMGALVGGAAGGTAGQIAGRELTDEQQLNEIAPLLALGARLFMAAAPKIAQVFGKVGQAGARGVGQAAKAGAGIAAKNAGQIGIGAGAYEIGSSVADIVKDITTKVGAAVDEKTIFDLATLAFKYAIPAGIVLAILYGGKKAIDSLFADPKTQQGVAEGECPMCVESGTTCKECSMQMESLSQILRNAGIKKV